MYIHSCKIYKIHTNLQEILNIIPVQCTHFVTKHMKNVIIHVTYYRNDEILTKQNRKSNEYHAKHQT